MPLEDQNRRHTFRATLPDQQLLEEPRFVLPAPCPFFGLPPTDSSIAAIIDVAARHDMS